ncbi:sigma 54-interacting transcriptional regulator [Limnobaculum xujianqingii]|uniref:sigma 54-interacting transcriptional regulator n=1 Tax=Limnobaculum xujianqingii TaxID=2738837 RepID=UPI00112864C7|nr:sigma-54-dependent transcriptional regulator [Limnobaculum xujianqingii]
MRIDIVYDYLRKSNQPEGITASQLAENTGLSRANVSSELNKLVNQGKATKTKGKPVYYFCVEAQDVPQQVLSQQLDTFVEQNPSLYSAVAQAKAAILYPPQGMNLLLLGETGVGKSMFAEMLHAYAIETQQIAQDAPFVIFNCADYANNPQLLLAQLFGAKRGAYTGADEERIGLLEKANRGILFLDEVHRLPPEGQEMFFTFIDKGIYRRLGETAIERTAPVRIFAATTESPQSALLNTFTRRFPMAITLPALRSRTFEERFNLIKRFFSQEAGHLHSQITVSANTLRALLSYDCANNVGQLKSDIRFACASAYVEYCSGKTAQIEVYSRTLPDYANNALFTHIEHRQIWNKIIGINKKSIVFSADDACIFVEDHPADNIYDMLNLRMSELKSLGVDDSVLEKTIENDIAEYFQMHINSATRHYNSSKLDSLVSEKTLRLTEELIQYVEVKFQRPLNPRLYYGLANHIEHAVERVRSNKCIVHPQLNRIRTSHSEMFNVALDCLHMIERVMEVTLPIDEAGFLTMFLVFGERGIDLQHNDVQIFVVAHGKNTASALADTANELLGVNYAIAFNAPLEEKAQQVLERIIDYIRTSKNQSDIMLLVDMGSLTTFAATIEQQCGIKVASLQLISTMHVIEAIQSAMNGNSLSEVYQDVQKVNQFLTSQVNPTDSTQSPVREHLISRKLAIITLCTTGEGTAQVIENLLIKSLSYRKNLIDIIPLNINSESSVKRHIERLSADYMIIAIVSPFPIYCDIPLFDLADILHRNGISSLQSLIDTEATYSLVTGTLEQLIVNLPPDYLVSEIRKFNNKIIASLGVSQSTNLLIGLIMHIACMLDRLKAGESGHRFKDKPQYLEQHADEIRLIKQAITSLEQAFNVTLVDDELCSIHRFYRQ